MLTFNTILRCEGIDPASVRLVRHQDTRGPGPSPYELWRANDGRFEQYQRLQKEPVNFGVGHLLASFVAHPRTRRYSLVYTESMLFLRLLQGPCARSYRPIEGSAAMCFSISDPIAGSLDILAF